MASLVDGLILSIPGWTFSADAGPFDFDASGVEGTTWFVLSWLIGSAYNIIAVANYGRTIGKAMLGIEVVDALTGERPDLGKAVTRALPQLLGIIPFAFALSWIFYLPILWRESRQGFHDQLAGTLVVRQEVGP